MAVTTRAVLVVHPEAERRTQLRAVLAGYEILEASNRQEAVEFLTRAAPVLVLTHPEAFPRLLKDLERHAPRSIRAVLCPRDDARAHHSLVDVAAAGHMFFTLEDEPGPELRRAVLELLELRESGRRSPEGELEARFVAGGTAFRAGVLDVGTGGLGLRLDPSVRIERLTPGTPLEDLEVTRGGGVVLRASHGTVRLVRPLREEGHGFHLGVSLERPMEHGRSNPAPLMQDAVRIRGLLRRAVRAGVGFGLRTHEGNRLVDFSRGELLPGESRLLLREQSQSGALFRPGDVVQLCLDFGGVCHVGTTAVLAAEAGQLEVALPRSLSLHHRRNSLRFRSTAERPFAVSFTSPLTGDILYRPLLDLHTGGFAFPFDAGREVFPPGLVLEEVTLHLPDGTRSRCRAQVQDTGPLTVADEGGGMDRPRRCGVKLLELAPEARTAILDAFIQARCADVRDGSQLPFEDIWDVFRAADVRFPDYTFSSDGPAPEPLAAAHRALGNGTHGLSKTLVYQREGRLYGHISGLRIYSGTWLSQHLVVRPGYHRHESISQELVALAADYAESLQDVEYLRALWRCRNRWTSRIYGAIASRLERPGLSCLHAFTPCRLPVDAALAPPRADLRVRPASVADLRWLEQYLRETQDVVRLRSSDLVEGEMGLGTLQGRYAGVGLRRSRAISLVEGQNGPLGFVLMEDSTPGLFWAEWYNAFSLVMMEQEPQEADAVRHALVAHAVADAARRGRSTAECLATDADLPALEALGFHNLGKVMEFTCHRRLVRDWNAYLLAVFERLAAHPRGSRVDDKEIAA